MAKRDVPTEKKKTPLAKREVPTKKKITPLAKKGVPTEKEVTPPAKKGVPTAKKITAFVSKEERDLKFRDLSITKVCDNCGKEYHPRKNSYQTTSRFCNAKCFREGFRKGTVAKLQFGRPPGR